MGMKHRNKSLFLLFVLTLLVSTSVFAYESPFNVMWEDSVIQVEAGSNVSTDVVLGIPKGYHVYSDKTDLEFTVLDGIRVEDIQFPVPILQKDSTPDEPIYIFPEEEVAIHVVLSAPKGLTAGLHEVAAVLEFQGCQDKLCLKPERREIVWKVEVSSGNAIGEMKGNTVIHEESTFKELFQAKNFEHVIGGGWLLAVVIAFLAGVLTSLTPCVLPLLPITLTIIGVHKKGRVRENLLLSLFLVAGIAVTYSVLGVIAASVGKSIGFLFQSRIFLVLVILFFLSMSLSMFGIITLRLPQSIQNRLSRLGGTGYLGAFLAGISVGVLATPCVGPILGAILVWVVAKKAYLFGGVLLAVYALGFGTLYMVVGTFFGTLASRIKNIKVGGIVKISLGVLLLLPAIYYSTSLIGYNDGTRTYIHWAPDEKTAVVESVVNKKPIMVVFSASWCPPCVELKKNVLSSKEMEEISKSFVMVYIDASVDSEETSSVVNKYNVIGWPTILFVSPSGKVHDDLTIVGDVPTVDELLVIMRKAAER